MRPLGKRRGGVFVTAGHRASPPSAHLSRTPVGLGRVTARPQPPEASAGKSPWTGPPHRPVPGATPTDS